MKIFSSRVSLFICIFMSIAYLSYSQQWYQKGNPHFIDEKGFNQKVKNPETRTKGVVILKFFTPWCRYCRYLKDIIDKLKTQQNWSITIYQVNCDSQSHHFCGQMEVRSYPKMSVFEDGQFKESMDGFYPYQVVRQLFVKYNRTVETSTGHAQKQQSANDLQSKQTQQQPNFIDPVVITPEKKEQINIPTPQHKDAKRKQKKSQSKQESTKIKSHKVPQIKDETSYQPQSQTSPQPQPKPQAKPSHQQQPQVLPSAQPSPQQPVQQPQVQVHHKSQQERPQISDKKKSQKTIEEQNIVIVDQKQKETEQQRKIAQQIQKQSTNLIDLTKGLPQSVQVHQYGKYIMYGVCLIFGCYYFMHIMKADSHNQSGKQEVGNQQQGNRRTTKSIIGSKISIEDSELRQQLNFQHPNEEQINLSRVQVKDEDL